MIVLYAAMMILFGMPFFWGGVAITQALIGTESNYTLVGGVVGIVVFVGLYVLHEYFEQRSWKKYCAQLNDRQATLRRPPQHREPFVRGLPTTKDQPTTRY